MSDAKQVSGVAASAAVAAAATAAKDQTAAAAKAGTASGAADDDDDRPAQSFEGPEKLLEIWWIPPPWPPAPGAPPTLNKQQSVVDVSNPKIKRFGLRLISREKLEEMLESVAVRIINCVSNEYVDAYLLSESSMFVYPFKIVLKTCGTTTLLKAIHPILNLARDECALTELNNVFYSRKNFLDPSKQLYPHTSFDDECKVLDQVFSGQAYVLGQTNGDHWYLYMTDKKENQSIFSPAYRPATNSPPTARAAGNTDAPSPSAIALPPSGSASAPASPAKKPKADGSTSPSVPSGGAAAAAGAAAAPADSKDQKSSTLTPPSSTSAMTRNLSSNTLATLSAEGGPSQVPGVSAQLFAKSSKKADQTLEVLMTDLDQKKMKIFVKKDGFDAKRVTKESGIGGLYDNAIIDDFLFDPQGYSMNGLRERGYFTIHITPQANCSYASFETNIPPHTTKNADEYLRLIRQNLEIFGPGKLTVTLFANDTASEQFGFDAKALFVDIPGYSRTAKILYEFENYKLSYCHYTKDKPR